MSFSFDDLLSCRGRFAPGHPDPPLRTWILVAAAGGMIHGAVMGSFNGYPLQAIYSAIKTPLLLVVAGLIVAPNTIAVHAAIGLQGDARRVIAAIAASFATFGLALSSLAPLTAFAYLSGITYPQATGINGLEYGAALIASHRTLRHHYRALLDIDPRHRLTARLWTSLYGLIAIQLAWMMRPFIGWSEQPPTFVRTEAWDNAYVIILDILRRALSL